MAGLLHPAQHHDLDEAADMQRRRGRIEADITRHHLTQGDGVEPFGVSQLVDITALVE